LLQVQATLTPAGSEKKPRGNFNFLLALLHMDDRCEHREKESFASASKPAAAGVCNK
jgi:hypothetical protein